MENGTPMTMTTTDGDSDTITPMDKKYAMWYDIGYWVGMAYIVFGCFFLAGVLWNYFVQLAIAGSMLIAAGVLWPRLKKTGYDHWFYLIRH